MKRRTRRKVFTSLLAVMILFVCAFSTVAMAEEPDMQNAHVYKYEVEVGPNGEGTLKPMAVINPSTPYMLAVDLWGGYTSELIPFQGGNAVSVSASAIGASGETILGAFVTTLLLEDGTIDSPLDLKSPVDGNIYTTTARIKDGGEYRIKCGINSPYQDTWVKYYVVVVIYTE